MKKKYFRDKPLRLVYKRRIFRTLKISFFLFSVFYFMGAVAVLSWLDIIEVSNLEIVGNLAVPKEVITASAVSVVKDGKFQIWNKNSVIFYPSRLVERKILKDLKAIFSVEVKRSSLDSVSISVVERKQIGLWCQEKREEGGIDSADECYFVDSEGMIFNKAPTFSKPIFVRFRGGFQGDNPIGSEFTSREVFKEAQFFINTLRSEGITISDFEFDEQGDYRIKTLEGADIFISPRVGMSRSLDNFLSFLGGGEEVGESVSYADYEYIDLRFGSKIFYRLRGD